VKRGTIFLGLALLILASAVYAQEKGPAAVSPASDMGIAKVGQLCPTFSWTAVDWATAYRVEVFKAAGGEIQEHQDMATASYPVLVKEILGAATSWTPSTDEQLNRDDIYVWYVQAIDESGAGMWSQGRLFQIEVALGLAPIEEALNETLEEHGVDREVIDEAIDNIRDKAKGTGGEIPALISDDKPVASIQAGTEDAWRTRLGLYAGTQNTSSTGNHNAYLGYAAGYANTTGDYNTFIGHYAGRYTTASYNTMVGYEAGLNNNSGYDNTYVGIYAGRSNTGGYRNTFIGRQAGHANLTGDYNTFVGYQAGYLNTTNSNTFIGSFAGDSNTSGTSNTFIGYNAGQANTTYSNNTYVGYYAGYNNTGGTRNTFMGTNTGYSNSTGYDNTLIGYRAGDSNTTGFRNTFIGSYAGQANTTADYNTFLGYYTGYSTTTGNYNTCLGYGAGRNNVSGSGNVFLGREAGYNETGSNRLYIDNSNTSTPLIYGDFANNYVGVHGRLGVGTKTPGYPIELETTGANAAFVLQRTDGATNYVNATASFGNFGTVTNHPLGLAVNALHRLVLWTDNSLTMLNGASCTAGGTWVNASSRDLKENITMLGVDEALNTLEGLNPVKYNYKADADEDCIGFIAEDVPDLVATKDRKGMSSMDVVAVLTKVLQEQQKTIDKLAKKIEELEKK
jgi:hypothetical protein